MPVGRPGGPDVAAVQADPVDATKGAAESEPRTLESAIREINDSMLDHSVGVRFEIDSETDRVVVKVVDRNSGELIRQMPSEEVLRIAKLLGKFPGVLMDESA